MSQSRTILAALAERPVMTKKEIFKALDCHIAYSTLGVLLGDLLAEKKIARYGHGRYCLAENLSRLGIVEFSLTQLVSDRMISSRELMAAYQQFIGRATKLPYPVSMLEGELNKLVLKGWLVAHRPKRREHTTYAKSELGQMILG